MQEDFVHFWDIQGMQEVPVVKLRELVVGQAENLIETVTLLESLSKTYGALPADYLKIKLGV